MQEFLKYRENRETFLYANIMRTEMNLLYPPFMSRNFPVLQ